MLTCPFKHLLKKLSCGTKGPSCVWMSRLLHCIVSFQRLSSAATSCSRLKETFDMLDSVGTSKTDNILQQCASTPKRRKTETTPTKASLKEQLSKLNSTPTSVRKSRFSEKGRKRCWPDLQGRIYALRNLKSKT